jgi:hypothetical protein
LFSPQHALSIGWRAPSLKRLLRRDPVRLVFDPDSVRDARDVVEVADDLDRVRDRRVVEAVRAEGVDLGLADLRGPMRELDREVAQGPLARRELGSAVVVLRVLRDIVCGALGTEVVGVSLRSVAAALLGGCDRREELALLARKPGLPEHDLSIQSHRRSQDRGPKAHRLQDVEDLARALERGVVLLA